MRVAMVLAAIAVIWDQKGEASRVKIRRGARDRISVFDVMGNPVPLIRGKEISAGAEVLYMVGREMTAAALADAMGLK
jgi:hypothetical protein